MTTAMHLTRAQLSARRTELEDELTAVGARRARVGARIGLAVALPDQADPVELCALRRERSELEERFEELLSADAQIRGLIAQQKGS